MNILLIGDSWGVPNYSENYSVKPESHTEFLLREYGHTVFNYSLNGGSNIDTIEFAKTGLSLQGFDPNILQLLEQKCINPANFLTGKVVRNPLPVYKGEKIDWILWFHTESFRESLFNWSYKYHNLETIHVFNCQAMYAAFASFVSLLPNVKTAVIGGQAPIDPLLYKFHSPDFVIEDWRSEIVGFKLPYCHTLSRLDLVEKSSDSKETKIKILDNHSKILKAMMNVSLFHDRCHPGPDAHKKLSQTLNKIFIER